MTPLLSTAVAPRTSTREKPHAAQSRCRLTAHLKNSSARCGGNSNAGFRTGDFYVCRVIRTQRVAGTAGIRKRASCGSCEVAARRLEASPGEGAHRRIADGQTLGVERAVVVNG